MNKFILTFLLAVLTFGVALAGDNTHKVDAEKSSVLWLGKKFTGAHDGAVGISEGVLEFTDGKLTGGSFVIDMTTITCTDIKDEGMNGKLVGHLKSDDFFGVEEHPHAKLTITSVEDKGNETYGVTADLTIKGITESVTFDAQVSSEDGYSTANAEIEIDRTLFNVRYGSKKFFDNLGDRFIYDIFTMTVKLVAAVS